MVLRRAIDLMSKYRNAEDKLKKKKDCKKQKRDAAIIQLFKYSILSSLGILMLIWSPFDLAMTERLRLRKGLPPFEWWKTPPDVIFVKVYVFNYTNMDLFLSGKADKLSVEEVGPIIYKEIFTHKNIIYNKNSTISYTINHTIKYVPEINTVDLDEMVVIPNYVVLRLQSKVYKEISIRDFLWNLTDPIMDLGNSIVPGIVPVNNIGILHRMYENFEDRVTMYMGTKHGNDLFSLIENINGKNTLPSHRICKDKVSNSSEGVTYNQYLKKDVNIRYWRKTLCRVFELKFDKEIVYGGFNAYKYTLPPFAYDRKVPLEDDCYKGSPTFPNGLSDVSNCFYNVPIAASFPHFMHGDAVIKESVAGLNPSPEKHDSFIIAEPVSGIPLRSVARSQSNLVVRELKGFPSNCTKFSELVLPMFWAEYAQEGVPLHIQIFLYIIIVILRPAQILIVISLFVLATYHLLKFLKIVKPSLVSFSNISNTNNFEGLEAEFFISRNTGTR